MQAEASRATSRECQINKVKADEENALEESEDVDEKCSRWIETCSIASSDCSALTENTENSALECGYVFQNQEVVVGNQIVNKLGDHNIQVVLNRDKQTSDNIVIKNSKKIVIGDVIIINTAEQLKTPPQEERPLDFSLVVPRTNWLAQSVPERDYLSGPAKFIIISHTNTEEGFTEAKNVLLVRLLQTFHIESRGWDDVAYNFMIGSDSLAYEGRGWGVVGAHTRSYNWHSIGISFIGNFIDHLPPKRSLLKAQKLIEIGVKMGHIVEDYQLLAHCQCSAVLSPGKALFEEIKTWKNWNPNISTDNPAPEILKS